MSNRDIEEKIARLKGKIKMYERHAVHRKMDEANAEIARLEAQTAAEEAKEVKLSDVKDLAPTPEKAASARKAATRKTETPVARRTPAKAKTTVASDEKDET